MNLASIKKGFKSKLRLEKKELSVFAIDNLIDDSCSLTEINCYQDREKLDFEIGMNISHKKALPNNEVEEIIAEFKDKVEVQIIVTSPIYAESEKCICPIKDYFEYDNLSLSYSDILLLRSAIACDSIQLRKSNLDIEKIRSNFFEAKNFNQLKGFNRNILATWVYFKNEY